MFRGRLSKREEQELAREIRSHDVDYVMWRMTNDEEGKHKDETSAQGAQLVDAPHARTVRSLPH